MRKSLRQLQKNQVKAELDENKEESKDVSPTKRQRVLPGKGRKEKLPPPSLVKRYEVQTSGSESMARQRKSPVKLAFSGSSDKFVNISSGPKPCYSKELEVKVEKQENLSEIGGSHTKDDENRDPKDVKATSPKKTRGKEQIGPPRKVGETDQFKFLKEEPVHVAEIDDVKPSLDELRSDESGGEQDSLSYAQIREKNLRENELFFASLGIQEAKEMLHASVPKPNKPTQRGLKVKKEVEILPRRQSLRIKRIDPEGNQLPEPEPLEQVVEETRLPSEPLGMTECLHAKFVQDTDHVSAFKNLMKGTESNPISSHSKKMADFTAGLAKMSICETGVAKVVPERVFSVAWHPAMSPLLTIAGDKWGAVGLWNVLSGDEDRLTAVFKPHTRPVSCLEVPPGAQHKLYSCSYDATLRCGDFEKGIFTEVFSVPETDDDLFRNFNFYDDYRTLLVSHFSGNVSVVDVRTPNTSAEQVFKVSHKSLRTVSINPAQPDHFITAGTAANICLWDLRKMNQKSPKPVQTLGEHTKSIASAYFSPLGDQILSSAADDQILVYDVPTSGAEIKLNRRIRHNNCTGRWLTNFRPTWHPTEHSVFVVGSMARPREIQVFDAVSGRVLRSLSDEDYLGSVCSLNVFHPNRPHTLVGANSSGRLHVFL